MVLKDLTTGLSISIINISKTIAICNAYQLPIGFGIRSTIWGGIFSIFCQAPGVLITISILAIMLLEGINKEEIALYIFMSSVYSFIWLYFNIYMYISLVANSILDSNWICIVILTFFSQINKVAGVECNNDNFNYNINKIFYKINCLKQNYMDINYYNIWIYFSLIPILYYLSTKYHSVPWYAIIIIIFSLILFIFNFFNINLNWDTVLKKESPSLIIYPFEFLNLSTFKVIDKFLDINFHNISFSMAAMNILDCFFTLKYIDRFYERTKKKYIDFWVYNLVNFSSIITGVNLSVLSTSLSVLSLNNGLRTGLYAFFNGIFCLIFSLFFLNLLKYTPKIVLEIVLITICIEISNFESFFLKYKYDKNEFIVMVFTVIFTLLFKGIIPIILGMIIHLMINSRSLNCINNEFKQIFTKEEIEMTLKEELGMNNWYIEKKFFQFPNETENIKINKKRDPDDYIELIDDLRKDDYEKKWNEIKNLCIEYKNIFIYRIIGNLTYLNINLHLTKITKFIDDYFIILISLRFLNYVDHSSVEYLNNFIIEKEKKFKIKFILIGSIDSKISHSFKNLS